MPHVARAYLLVVAAAGWGNCDGKDNNGCEVDVWNSPANCGSCGFGCQSGQPCDTGICVSNLKIWGERPLYIYGAWC